MTPCAATPLERCPMANERTELVALIENWYDGPEVVTDFGLLADRISAAGYTRAPSSPLIAPERGNSDATGARDTTGTGTQAVSSSPLVGELIEALEKYGAHEPTCGTYEDGSLATTDCTCGLESALARGGKERG